VFIAIDALVFYFFETGTYRYIFSAASGVWKRIQTTLNSLH
jgi:Uri superfamily endonuclease